MFNEEYIISEDKIRIILNHCFQQCRVVSVENMSYGVASVMFKVQIESPNKTLVLRILDPKRGPAFKKEIGFIKYCEKIKFKNIPQILFCDNSRKIISEDYYLYLYIQGTPLSQYIKRLNLEERKSTYMKIGKLLGKLHVHKNNFCSDIFFENNTIKLHQRRPQKLIKVIEDFQWILENDFIDSIKFAKYAPKCKALFEKYGGFLSKPVKNIGLGHFDLSCENIIVDKRGNLTFIDFEYSGFSNICLDLARCERRLFTWRKVLSKAQVAKMKMSFFEGYVLKNQIPLDYINEKNVFMLVQIMDDIGMLSDWYVKYSQSELKSMREIFVRELEYLLEESL